MFCECELPVKVVKFVNDGYKKSYCATCSLQIDPLSKAVDKNIEKLNLVSPSNNDKIIQEKINEIIDLLISEGIVKW